MAESMLEKVARAMAAAYVDNELDNIEINPSRYADDNWHRYVDLARAAVEAMRVPPDGLRFAVGEWLEREGLSMDVSSADVWRLGIDVILAEK